MKRIGKLYGKAIVEGDPNTITPNQILAKKNNDQIDLQVRDNGQLKSITSGSSTSTNRYWKAKEGVVSLSKFMEAYTGKEEIFQLSLYVGVFMNDEKDLGPYNLVQSSSQALLGIADFGIPLKISELSVLIGDGILYYSDLINMANKEIFDTLFEECSEEEWYNLANIN